MIQLSSQKLSGNAFFLIQTFFKGEPLSASLYVHSNIQFKGTSFHRLT